MKVIPDSNLTSLISFLERASSGTSWSIRDNSIWNRVKGLRLHHFTATDEIAVGPFGIALAQGGILQMFWEARDTRYIGARHA